MQKKLLLFIIFISFVFSSCLDYSLPKKVELETEVSLGFPVKTSFSNWASSLVKSLGDQFPENVEIYNVNYGSSQAVQAFCVYIPIPITDTLNPKEYLKDGIAKLANLGELDPDKQMTFNEDIDIPSANDFEFSYSINKDIDFTLIPFAEFTFPVSAKLELPDFIKSDQSDFIHAQIGNGSFTFDLELSNDNDEVDKKYNITMNQAPSTLPGLGTYDGLNYSSAAPYLSVQPFTSQDINKKDIEISGTITLTKKSSIGNVHVSKLIIKIDFSEFTELHWKLPDLSDKLKAEPLYLTEVAKNLNWIEFDACDFKTPDPTSGIGIIMDLDLSPPLRSRLKMDIKCDELQSDIKGPDALQNGNNVFGNKEDITDSKKLKLAPANDPDAVDRLQFGIELVSANPDNENVLFLEHLIPGDTLHINGTAEFFQNWKRAEVNVLAALKGHTEYGDGSFTGSFPNGEKDKSMDLSILKKYIEGFIFKPEDVTAMVYLSGPDEAIQSSPTLFGTSVKIDASYTYNDDSKKITIFDPQNLTLGTEHIILKEGEEYNSKYIDDKGSYKLPYLPNPEYGANKIQEFNTIFNDNPEDLIFDYKGQLPPEVIVTPEMFADLNDENADIAGDINAAIMIFINLRLYGDDDVNQIIFPESMFDGKNDLLGRAADENDPSKPEKNSLFTSATVDHLIFTIDFSGAFFSGGKFFIEKDNEQSKPILFPEGIPIDGSKITLNITNNKFETVKNYFIDPALRTEFRKGATLTIPKNMGLTSFKIEAKGKNTFDLEF